MEGEAKRGEGEGKRGKGEGSICQLIILYTRAITCTCTCSSQDNTCSVLLYAGVVDTL